MKKTFIMLACISTMATSAYATPKDNTPPPFQGGGDSTATAGALAAQAQGQIQGQAQGQSLYNTNKIGVDVDNTNRNTNRNSSLNLNSAGAAASNSFSYDGGTVNSVALAALAGGACTSGSLTAGAEGIGIGFSWSKNYCELIALAAAAELYGGNGAMIMCDNTLFRNTQPALCNPRVAITNQTYDGGKAGTAMTVSTRSVALYTSCSVVGNTPHITVPAGMGSDADYVDRAARACFATR